MSATTGIAKHYRAGKMQEVYQTRIQRGQVRDGAADGLDGLAANAYCENIGKVARARFFNPKTNVWSRVERFLIVDCSDPTVKQQPDGKLESDQQRHIRTGLVIEVDYETAKRHGFNWDGTKGEGKTYVEVQLEEVAMATLEEKTIDLEAQHALAVVERGNMSVRGLSMIHKSVVHWPGEDDIPMVTTEAQEIQLLKAFANYHVYTRNWDDTGRTLIRGSSIMYHWAIGLSGKRYRCRGERNVTWHCNKGNYEAVGTVVLMGTKGKLTPAARETLLQHLAWLDARTDIGVLRDQHWGHGECGGIYGGGPSWGNATTCPGPELLELVKKYRKGAIMPGPTPTPIPGPNTEFFPQTGHNLSNAFRDYWKANGGLGRFGYPLTEEISGDVYPFSCLPELSGYTVQLFERGLLHYKAGQGVGQGRDGALVQAVTSGGPNEASDN